MILWLFLAILLYFFVFSGFTFLFWIEFPILFSQVACNLRYDSLFYFVSKYTNIIKCKGVSFSISLGIPKESFFVLLADWSGHYSSLRYTSWKTRYFCMHQLYNVLIYIWIALDPKGSIYGAPKKILIYEETAPHATIKFCMKLEGNIFV